MDVKDFIILALLGVGGYLFYRSEKDRKQRAYASSLRPGSRGGQPSDAASSPANYTGAQRIGMAITTVGGRALAEGAKAQKLGPAAYGAHEHRKASVPMAAVTGTSGVS